MKTSIDIGRFVICLVIGAGAFFLMKWLYPNGADSNIQTLGLAIGWGGALIIAMIGMAVVYRMFTGSIDLTTLVSEPDGKASISRFQLLIFTFVISLSLLVIIVSNKEGPKFPDKIPPEILGLLGISAGSYVVSKSLQNNAADSPATPANPATPPAGAGGSPVTPLAVAVSPAALALVAGQSASLGATASGNGTLLYEWQKADAGGTVWQSLVDQTQPSLKLTPVLADNGAQYRCKVSDSSGSMVSAAVPVSVTADRG